jgi:chromosome segregation ATPase
MEQRNGQLEVYRTPNAAKAASMVADGHLGHGGCNERAMDREMAVGIALRFAAEERKKLQRKRARSSEPPATPEAPGAGADSAAVAAELAAMKTELAQSEAALQYAVAALAASQSRVAELEAEATRIRRVLSDASAELTHATREAEAHSTLARARVAQLYADIEAINGAAA